MERTRALSLSSVVLPIPGPAQQQQALSGFNHVAKHIDGAVDGAADTARQSDNLISPIAKCGNAVQCSFDARAIVFSESTNAMRDVIEIFACDCSVGQVNSPVRKARFGTAAQVQNHFNQIFEIRLRRSAAVKWGGIT